MRVRAMKMSAVLFLWGCLCFPLFAADSLSLAGPWKFIAGDGNKCAAPGYDASSHADIDLPGDWLFHLKGNENLAALVWLRKTVDIPASFAGEPLMLYLGEIGIADEAYFNGERIGSTGVVPRDPDTLRYRMTWRFPRYYHIPPGLVRHDRPNVVAVKVFSHVFSGMRGEPAIMRDKASSSLRFFRDHSAIVINICALALNVVFFSIFLMLSLANIRRIEYLYLAVILFLGVLLNLPFIGLPWSAPGLQQFKFILLVYVIINYYIFITLQRLLKTSYDKAAYALTVLLLFLAAGVVMAPTTSFLILTCGLMAVAYVNVLLAMTLFVFVSALKRDPLRYWYLAFLVLLVPFSFWRNTYYLLSMRFNEMGGFIFLHIPMLIYAFMLYFFYDYEYTRRNHESLYRSLMEKTLKLQSALGIAKKDRPRRGPREAVTFLIEYLDANYRERYNRKDLARKFGLNEDYMMQLFKKTTGVTISTYINTKRVEAVKVFLVDTEIKIIDIAYHVGFDNYTHFHRLFKKSTGLTPVEYREYARRARDD
jgi:two-component system response regulator YesN